MLIPSWFQVFLSLTDVADISLFSQLLAWLFSACILTWFMPVRVKGGPEPTKWLPYCAHMDYRGVVSISEVSGSGMHFLVLVSDSRNPILHLSLLVWPLPLHPHIWIPDTCWLSLRYDLWVLNSALESLLKILSCCIAIFPQTHFLAIG